MPIRSGHDTRPNKLDFLQAVSGGGAGALCGDPSFAGIHSDHQPRAGQRHSLVF